MAVLIFVLFWVLVAITLLFIGLSGGARGARERLHKQSRTGRRVSYGLFGLTLVLFGVVVPAAVVAGVEGRDSAPEYGISNLTDEQERGRAIFGRTCNQCHTLAAAGGSSNVGPNLDVLRPTYGLVLDAIENGRARGNGAMAADLVEGEDAQAVASFVAKAVGQPAEPPAEDGEQQGGDGEQPGAGEGGGGEEAGGEEAAEGFQQDAEQAAGGEEAE